MSQTFDCPQCGGPLAIPNGSETTIKCPYCHSIVIVPEALRKPQLEPIVSRGILETFLSFFAITTLAPIVITLVIVAAVCVGIFFMTNAISSALRTDIPAAPIQPVLRTTVIELVKTPTRAPSTTPTPGFASVALKFGGSGTGAGLFTDARSIGVDGVGNIYVGEYTGGRIQVFDSSGKFTTQWSIDPQSPLRGFAVDRKGTAYVAQKGIIAKYEAATGKPLGQLQFPDNRFDQVITTPDGGLLALWFEARTGIFTSTVGARDDLVRFDRDGKVVKTVTGFLSGLTNNPEFDTKIAVDGLGNIFAVAGVFNPAVYRFTLDVKYENKFGSRGDQPGQFRSPGAIAIDNQSRVYVADSRGIQVFAPDGRYLDTFPVDGSVFGMVFNDKNELFVVARNQVLKFILIKP